VCRYSFCSLFHLSIPCVCMFGGHCLVISGLAAHVELVSILIVNILINSRLCMNNRSELALQLTDAVAAAQAAVERAGDRAFRAYGLSHRAHAALNAVDGSGPDRGRPKDVR